ncbi:hypothetical protein Ppa06_69120 [Planomonospora parontospora subsp. parontospora]|uniref:Uncharacterized protein n=2 Tax=Planomonospora parontospora TaxID=58119 RepID=A0AA37BP69_9ACTN|nr:hypothetical protein [Planomonospora parontospora]GGL00681.1 hypothetical protein GCM10010126_70000 [Planomonospora parontospora]GII13114.1 hypothetical protein Ppa06_69120 [Planomonospora parontospora subsp. parontospora]
MTAGSPAGEQRGTERLVAVLVTETTAAAAPPGVDPAAFLTAVAEDTYEMAAGLDFVTPVLVTSVPGMEEIVWPGTPVVEIAPGLSGAALVAAAFAALPYGGQAALVSADAPDLPPLLIGKLFRALGRARIAVCPAQGGGAVALAAHLPYPGWADTGFDDPDPVGALRDRAPGSRMVATGPGWHRLRTPGDVGRLDPGLEGWDNTRALLSA